MRSWMKDSSVKKMTETEAAWLAGFMDGEGSISCYMGGRAQQFRSWVLTAPNTHHGSIVRCLEITGAGKIRDKKSRKPNPIHKPMWIWAVNSKREIRDVIQQIYPYLVIKKTQADVFLAEFQEI